MIVTVSNGPKEHRHGDHSEDVGLESWRTGSQQHSNYPMGAGEAYNHYYPGTSFSYQAFGAGDGTWSNGTTDPVAFLSGYGSQMGHDAYGMDGMYSAGSGGGFNTFGQPAFNYFPGNGDYNAWGTPRKARYEDYYQSDVKSVEQSVQGLSLNDGAKPEGSKEPRKITWASVASQPAKPVAPLSSNQGMKKKAGMPPPPIVPGKHNMDIGTWGEGKSSSNPPPPKAPPPPHVQPPVLPPQQQRQQTQRAPAAPAWNRRAASPGAPRAPSPPPASQPSPPQQHRAPPQQQPPPPSQQQFLPQAPSPTNLSHPVLDELKIKNDYNPIEFIQTEPSTRFFVIKSYSEDDIHRSIKYEIWCSTEHGNKRLDQAFREVNRDGAPLYLFFSVNGSGHFCGMAQMVSAVDYQSNSSVWSQDKWKGQFRVRWIYVKDVPNGHLRHIKLENNENKPVTNSRDAQEVPYAKGVQVLWIMHTYRHSTSIFDDFGHYEQRQAEEDQRKAPVPVMPHHPPPPNHRGERANDRDRGDRPNRPYPPEHMSRNRDHHQYRDQQPQSARDHHQRRVRSNLVSTWNSMFLYTFCLVNFFFFFCLFIKFQNIKCDLFNVDVQQFFIVNIPMNNDFLRLLIFL